MHYPSGEKELQCLHSVSQTLPGHQAVRLGDPLPEADHGGQEPGAGCVEEVCVPHSC